MLKSSHWSWSEDIFRPSFDGLSLEASGLVKGTLHSKLTPGFFSWPKSIYYFDLSLTNCTFVKLELMEQGTTLYGNH